MSVDSSKHPVQRRKTDGIIDWIKRNKLSTRLTLLFLGIVSTIWFLIRVIPKPSRASYPCMRVAAPYMSGLAIYLLSLGGITIFMRKARMYFSRAKYIAAGSFVFLALAGIIITVIQNNQVSMARILMSTGPDDGPNEPMGEGIGINPGRVVWAWDPEATNENLTGRYYIPENNNQEAISTMLNESIKKLSGEANVTESWDAIFKNFNSRKHSVSRGYSAGEKIFIKINQTTARIVLDTINRIKGDYTINSGSPRVDGMDDGVIGTCQTSPQVALALMRQLVNQCGINQSDIAIGDPQNPTFAFNYDVWADEFPDIIYTDNTYGTHGRTLIHETTNDLIFYSDNRNTDKFYDVIEDADYMINIANLKPHELAGITLMAKNHFGTQSRKSAGHLHNSLIAPIVKSMPTNVGYRKYRVLVDIMGSKYLGRNTILNIVDGLFAGGDSELGPPVKYFMSPFNNDWCNSIFISEDQVALESVCYDFLRTEFDGTRKHSPTNSVTEKLPNANGVDDYLHQAADKSNWPEGITYDPDNSGKPIPSLGVHEHWNDGVRKQYSRNLGKSRGIELISVHSGMTGPETTHGTSKTQKSVSDIYESPTDQPGKPETNESKFSSVSTIPFRDGFTARKFYSGIILDNGHKWFLTDKGVVRIGLDPKMVESNIPKEKLKDIALQSSPEGSKVWLAASQGLLSAEMPVNSNTLLEVYNSENYPQLGDSVFAVAVGENNVKWTITEKGVAGMLNNKWLTPQYENEYREKLFQIIPISAMATNRIGDSAWVATLGAGVGRFYMNDVDGISGASNYAQWGPIIMPSDMIYSICVTEEAQWLGTDMGIAKHTGSNTLENWTVYNTENGLVDNFVQAIASDLHGNIWVGTKGGISVLDSGQWTSYTVEDGLISNNILCILCDKDGSIYFGTDRGLMIYNNGDLFCYQ